MKALLTRICFFVFATGYVSAQTVSGCVDGYAAPMKPVKSLKVMFTTHDGQPGGTATLKAEKDGSVKVKLELKNIPFGPHGVHIHQNAVCEAPDFKSAGGHFNPTGKKHGFENPEGHHAGDIPVNVNVGEDHTGSASFVLNDVTLTHSVPNSLFANGGTSIVVHEKADDMKTDPSGASGNRIACAVVKQ